jgi:hypothetical protein
MSSVSDIDVSAGTEHRMSWIDICRRVERRVQFYETVDCRRSFHCRIDLSSGTRVAENSDIYNGEYEIGSMVPREPWRTLSNDELSFLVASEANPTDMGRTVSVVRVADPSSDLRTGFSQREIVNLLLRVCDLNEPLTCIGRTSNPPALKTTTVDTSMKKFIGLHVDNWDDNPVQWRDRAINRISINIGRSVRYFLFLPLSVVEIAKLMADVIVCGRVQSPDYTGLGRLFVERFPNFPVVRCRLAPNEAYIAPTENLVHDGSSEDQKLLDEQFTILGHISVGVQGGPKS